jgi:two-component system, OmpR family, heavy metal sensor histidine kinase CusS
MLSMNSAKITTSTSITTRLTALYLLSTLAILVFTISFLLQTLVADLEYEDNDFLSERITSIAALIPSHPDTLTALKDQILINNSGQHTRYLVRVQDADGRTIMESPGMSSVPSDIFPPPVVSSHKIGNGIKFKAADSSHYLLNSAWAEGFGDSHFRLVQVALDVTGELALMDKYRLKMGVALLAGLVFAGGLGIIIARKGLQPLKEMAETVAQITATGLHQRVRSGSWPKELDHLTVALDTMLGRLEESFARLTEFSANLAHELRTPINNLRGEAEIALSRSRSADEYRRVVESSIEEYERLSRMISDILFLARPEQGVEKSPLNARAEIETLVEYFHGVAEEQQIKVAIKGNGTVLADPRLFQWAAGNIISNALHYTPDGGHITITISLLHDESLSITIQDTGMGIPPDELPRVFDRFYRSASARQRHNQGCGLGLAIVFSIMQFHGGTVALASEQGHGTKVTLQFPPQ